MPKRRTDDVVHAVMTDHYIRKRQPRRDLRAPLVERHDNRETAYRGEVVLYYPPDLAEGGAKDLYLAAAQVYAGANLEGGIGRLKEAIERHKPREVQFYHQLAEAYFRAGQDEPAADWYRKALERDANYLPSIRNLGATMSRMGRFSEAASILGRAPGDAAALNNLGEALLGQEQSDEAAKVLRRALEIDPESPEALNNLGRALARSGDPSGAEQAWRSAIRVKPDYALAHNNLANYLNTAGRWEEARRHFEEALLDGSFALARYNYGTALAERGQADSAERYLTEAVRLDPGLADAHLNLGNLYAMRGRPERAALHFRKALEAKPDFGRARLNLGVALAELGRIGEAVEQFQAAAGDSDARVRGDAERALQHLRQMGGR
jgi:Tfp pilus assembly protein PilF